jgi:hypothetical protein
MATTGSEEATEASLTAGLSLACCGLLVLRMHLESVLFHA